MVVDVLGFLGVFAYCLVIGICCSTLKLSATAMDAVATSVSFDCTYSTGMDSAVGEFGAYN